MLPSGLANSQDRVKLVKQDHSHQQLSCTSPIYNFGIVKWLRKGIEKVDRKTRKFITTEGIHYQKTGVNRLYIKRQNGGRGLVEMESAYNAAIAGLSEYIKQGKEIVNRLVQEYEAGKTKYSLKKKLI
jgi:hypothetical protein